MSWEPQVVRTVNLGYEQLLVLESQRGAVVRVLNGGVWLTQEGLARDIFAERDAEVLLEDGKVVVEGLGSASVQLVERVAPLSAAWERVRQGIHSAVRALHALRVRGQFGPRVGEPIA